MIAALYVELGGAYYGLPGVDPWDQARDARKYSGPWPVVAHPPCERWGRFWHGSPRKPHQFKLGDDGGCFAAALEAVRMYGGVLEHPADSHAWNAFGLCKPIRGYPGWFPADEFGGLTCYVEQGHYGHQARKATWLYACKVFTPKLRWGTLPQRLDPKIIERHGYEYARRKGMVSMIGGKDKKAKRNATPPDFRDLLLSIAATAGCELPCGSTSIEGSVLRRRMEAMTYCYMRMPGYYRAAEMKDGKIVEYSFATATELDAWVAKKETES